MHATVEVGLPCCVNDGASYPNMVENWPLVLRGSCCVPRPVFVLSGVGFPVIKKKFLGEGSRWPNRGTSRKFVVLLYRCLS